MPENGSLLIFGCAREPGVAAKRSAIEFAHSGRTLDRKEGSSHSFWSYCLATRLRQSNSPVARLPAPAPASSGGPGVGRVGGAGGTAFSWRLLCFPCTPTTSFHGSGPQVAVFQPSAFLQGKMVGEGRGESSPGGTEVTQNCFWTVTQEQKAREQTAGATEESFQ